MRNYFGSHVNQWSWCKIFKAQRKIGNWFLTPTLFKLYYTRKWEISRYCILSETNTSLKYFPSKLNDYTRWCCALSSAFLFIKAVASKLWCSTYHERLILTFFIPLYRNDQKSCLPNFIFTWDCLVFIFICWKVENLVFWNYSKIWDLNGLILFFFLGNMKMCLILYSKFFIAYYLLLVQETYCPKHITCRTTSENVFQRFFA